MGPDRYLIDPQSITDPLIARLPVPMDADFKPAHIMKELPVGYDQSIEQGKNVIADSDLHSYYDKLLAITRGAFFLFERLRAIWCLNTTQVKFNP